MGLKFVVGPYRRFVCDAKGSLHPKLERVPAGLVEFLAVAPKPRRKVVVREESDVSCILNIAYYV